MNENPTDIPEQGGSSYRKDLDAEYAQEGLVKMKAVLKGNGVKEEEIELKNFEGEILEFLASTILKLHTKISEKKVAGKVPGPRKLDSPQMVREAIEKEQHKITHSQDVIKRIKDAVLEREDKGFGLEHELIKLPFLHKEFVVYEECHACHAQGHVKCARCHGVGYEECPRCHAVGLEPCPQCQGNGQIMGQGNQYQPCPRCHGHKKITCSLCQQTKRIQCSVCKTKGSTTCKQCNGHAWNSNISIVEIDAFADFDYAKENVPERIQKVIAQLGPELIEHVQVTPITREIEPEQDEVPVPYIVRIPNGDIEFIIQGESVHGLAFGTQCELFNMPSFLEKIITPGMRSLKKAAEGLGPVSKNLQKAARYKTLKHAIVASVKFNKPKAVKAVLKNSPLGIEEETVQALVEQADQAIKNMTRQPQQIAIGVGAALTIGISAGYFLTPLRAFLQAQIANPKLYIASDVAIGLIAVAAGFLVAKIWISNARKKALKSIL